MKRKEKAIRSKKRKRNGIIILAVVIALILVSRGGSENDETPNEEYVPVVAIEEEETAEGVYGLGDTFEFDGSSGFVELTFGTDITYGLNLAWKPQTSHKASVFVNSLG